MSLAQAVEWLADDVPFLALAGAGLSIPAPACAPSVPQVMRTTIGVLADAANVSLGPGGVLSSKFIDRLLPESCYGAIAAAVGRADHLRLWESYHWVGDGPDEPRPNSGHHVLVDRAVHHGLPVLTTNFDPFLETAARLQGLDPVVSLPGADGSFAAQAAGAGQATIWKLHGTARQVRTIRSQPSDLVQSSYDALRRALPQQLTRFLLVGYSGKDFDVFPWLRGLALNGEVLWVDLEFKDDHRAWTLPHCLMYEGSFETLAQQYLAEHGADSPNAAAAAVPPGSLDPAWSDRVTSDFTARVQTAVREHVGQAVNAKPERARLALAITLNTVADFPQVADLGRGAGGTGSTDVRMLLATQFALESMDRYRSAEQVARLARGHAFRERAWLLFGRAELARVYSRFRRHFSTFTEPEVRSAYRNRRQSVSSFAWLALDAVALAPLFIYALAVRSRRSENIRHYDALAFGSDYTEHLVRLAGALMRLVARLPARPAVLIENAMWGNIGAMARRVGYMRGILNVAKYRARREPNPDAIVGSQFVGDLVAGAIAARDAALSCLKAANTPGTDDVRRAALLTEAQTHLDDSITKARECGNPSLVLKDWLIMRRYGLRTSFDEGEVSGWCNQLEGDTDCAAVPTIKRLLGVPVN